ncbi:MAG: MBL fold metallo-hydrolase [Enterocloster asparagiformis]|nr:MBL fold metallo-hydrolase [Enterocloster asparagiformis]
MFQISILAAIVSLLFAGSLCPLVWRFIDKKNPVKKPIKILISIALLFLTAFVTPESITEPSAIAETSIPETVNVESTTVELAKNTTEIAETSPQNIETVSVPVQSEEVKIHFIDVDQGDSILIQSGDHDMLIDAGENDKGDSVVTYLHSLGISELDYVIGTHPHSDHIGGLDDVINNFSIGTVIMPPVEHTTKTFEDVIDALSDQGLNLTEPKVGKSYQIGSASFDIIAPNKSYGDDLNNWSIGIKLTNGNDSFVMCGDAESQSETDICANGIDISADVLKLGHHGSNTSSSEAFLNAVNPKYAVISCGMGNSYGHPHQETMDKLSARGIQVFRTDEQGTIIATSSGNGITWSTEPSTSGNIGAAKETEAQTVPETTTAPETTAVPITEAQKSGLTYVLNTKTKKFHNPWCGSLPTKNRKDTDMSREEIIADGYTPCKKCNP